MANPKPSPTTASGKPAELVESGMRNDGNSRMGDPRSTTTGWRPTCEHDPNCHSFKEDDPDSLCIHCGKSWRSTLDGEPCIVPCLVLDPFAGSGTTGMVAIQHGRKFVGLDLNGDYLSNLATKRLSGIQKVLL